jgi:hypothetical protein
MKILINCGITSFYRKLPIIIGALFFVASCSDSSLLQDPSIPIPKQSAGALNVIVNGTIVDQESRDLIKNASVAFYKNSSPATNVLDFDGQSIDSLLTTDGSFQVTTEDGMNSFSLIVSSDGYFDKIIQVEFADDEKLVPLQIAMLPKALESVVVVQEEVAIGGSEVLEEISVSTENESDSTEGSAEVLLPVSVVLQDEDGVAVNMSSLSVEINYIESQGYDEPVVDEEPLSIASLIPEGLNADQTTDEVLVPVGVAEINMTTDDGTPIKKFSEPITITINLPEDTEVPSEGRNVQAGDQFTVRSFDSETLVWTTEENPAVVGDLSDGLYPANLQIRHLTIFALTDPVAACNSAIEFVITGDIPNSGLQMFVSSNDLEETVSIKSASTIITADEAKASGFVADVNKLYQVKVTDYSGNTWYESDDGLSLCGNTNEIEINNPVEVVDETLSIDLVCSTGSGIRSRLKNAVVSYRIDEVSVPFVASEISDGVYSLEQLDSSKSAYQVTINTRIDAGIVTTSVNPDGNDESYDIETECDEVTGAGTGTGSF